MEPRAVRAGGAQVESRAGNYSSDGTRGNAVENNGGSRPWQTEQIIGAGAVGDELENDDAGDVRGTVIKRRDGNVRTPLACRDGHNARQCDVINAIRGGAADGVGHVKTVIGCAEAKNGDGGVLRTAVGKEPERGIGCGP